MPRAARGATYRVSRAGATRRYLLAALALAAVVADDAAPAKPRRPKGGKPGGRPGKPGAGGRPGGKPGGKPGAGGKPGGRPTFEAMLELLKAYKAETGHVDVPLDHEADGPAGRPVKLGRWLMAVRRAHESDRIKDDREAALDAVDAKWAVTSQKLEDAPPRKRGGKGKKGAPSDD